MLTNLEYRSNLFISSVIADEAFSELKRLLHEADYLSVFCDGSTDRTETEILSNHGVPEL